jgi:predicted ribosome quality control (RQC) complex YloA/Tae2 family protein
VGRHFRLSHQVKVVVGRDEAENRFLERLRGGRWWFEVADAGSPLVLAQGDPDEELRRLIAAIAARYSSRRSQSLVGVIARYDERSESLTVAPASDAFLEQCRI